MKRLPVLLSSLVMVSMLISACSEEAPRTEEPPAEETEMIPFRKDGSLTLARDGEIYRTLDIEIADTDSTRNRGMMQRDGLPDDAGMLFIFEEESEQGFWMANTQIALDLIFVREDGTVLSLSKYVQPVSTETVRSNGPAMYVLEVEAGYSDSIGIIEGDVMAFERE
ncbi:MAG: DUF192 domain-containing protein [Bacteroidota bacterium]|nr:DUF192 domain-containing protein [Bacteroidota bacterium]